MNGIVAIGTRCRTQLDTPTVINPHERPVTAVAEEEEIVGRQATDAVTSDVTNGQHTIPAERIDMAEVALVQHRHEHAATA
jgi:hypothetical protein